MKDQPFFQPGSAVLGFARGSAPGPQDPQCAAATQPAHAVPPISSI